MQLPRRAPHRMLCKMNHPHYLFSSSEHWIECADIIRASHTTRLTKLQWWVFRGIMCWQMLAARGFLLDLHYSCSGVDLDQ
jgi:hypothetical protein